GLHENINRGCNTEELVGILLKNAFDIRSIRSAMGGHFPANSPGGWKAEGREADPLDLDTISRPRLVEPSSGAVLYPDPRGQVYCLPQFLSERECDDVVALVDPHLRPSTVTVESNDRYFRTSRTCDLSLIDTPLVASLDDKIARTLGISL